MTTSLSGERQDAFQRIIDSGRALLNNPSVAHELGDARTARYRTMLDGAFLPDIEDGLAVLPERQYGTDNIAIIPLIESDRTTGIRMHPSMLLPTGRRFDDVQQHLHERFGYTQADTEAAVDKAVLELAADVPNVASMSQKLKARTSGGIIIEVAEDELLTPRPHVVFNYGRTNASQAGIGTGVLHELSHAEDGENLRHFPRDMRDWIAFSELKATWVTVRCLEGAGVIDGDKIVDPKIVIGEGFRNCIRMERLRRQTNAHGRPFTRTPELTEAALAAY